jgi:hypothetical protein
MVQADRQGPSMITFWPELRSVSNLSRYAPIWPPGSPAIRTVAEAGKVKTVANMTAIAVLDTRIQSPDDAPSSFLTPVAGPLIQKFRRPATTNSPPASRGGVDELIE